jgi:1-acyl-sn-glycerol-3-phosphate acyltransferase
MNALLSIWAWVEITRVALLGFLVQTAFFVLCLPFDRRRLVAGRTFRLVGVVAARLNPFWRFGVVGPAPARPRGRTVVVSNHESNADPFLVSFLPGEMKCLGKASLFRIPVVGWMMRMAGDIPVERGDSDAARAAMGVCARWLDRGVPVMLFPEGTRSKDGQLLPFKDGAFRSPSRPGRTSSWRWPGPGPRFEAQLEVRARGRTGDRWLARLHLGNGPRGRRAAEGPRSRGDRVAAPSTRVRGRGHAFIAEDRRQLAGTGRADPNARWNRAEKWLWLGTPGPARAR